MQVLGRSHIARLPSRTKVRMPPLQRPSLFLPTTGFEAKAADGPHATSANLLLFREPLAFTWLSAGKPTSAHL